MSHDLRTPMNAIIGFAELMKRHWHERTLAENYLYKLEEASSYLLEIINNVLETARIESGKETLKEESNSLEKLYEDLKIITEGTMQEKHLTFSEDIHIRHDCVICDSLKLREIFVNILGNSVKYTPQYGQIRMTVTELESEKENYATYQTVIQDSGIGMSQEYLGHIFEPFSREKNSSESGVIGTGLGLSIVRSLVEMMGGKISVESEEGNGTKFTVVMSHPISEEQKNSAPSDKENWKKEKVRKTLLPASIPSTIPAAWEVLPLASSVEKQRVSFLFGRSLIKSEISTSLIKRPSSERSFRAEASVITYSRPSPEIWL